jgi:hypothetical protein
MGLVPNERVYAQEQEQEERVASTRTDTRTLKTLIRRNKSGG